VLACSLLVDTKDISEKRRSNLHAFMDKPFSTEHLAVRLDDNKRMIEDMLSSNPTGDESDTVLSVSLSSPHISLIVDHSITLKPGAELFTLVLGSKKQGWKPFGTAGTMEDESLPSSSTPAQSSSSSMKSNNASGKDGGGKKGGGGWPIFMQTAPGIKFLIKVNCLL
jgi:hypothetical protein